MNRLFACFSLVILFTSACTVAAPSGTATQDQAVPSGTVLFQDDFANLGSGWSRFSAAEGVMDYDSGSFRILVNALDTNFWSTPQKNFTDVRLEVDAGKLGGPDENRIGLICRSSGADYYFFIITSDGYYGVGLFSGGQAVLLGQNEMLTSENINKGLAVNHLRADCTGDQLTFYVNGFQIAAVQDATLKSGDVGMLVGTFAKPGVDVILDNFVALKP
ncbi:MAG TPA: hypothetical protein PLD33_06855 [Anaerolineales bacterium]|nr:hypothetical protein [Anaerolineales bacterium]HMX18054.1 hypothetical protein [Anaerolineales bacterium]HMZ41835.1 hypothetical protein [Anaerolineales bacterium]HNA52789.1 hypothetical protein [Anaerolineales bacterium]HNC87343.1 hypothetical protein [Anaerolineales bacterium]